MATAKGPIDLRWDRFPHRDGSCGPSERQVEFFACAAKEQLYGGIKSGGKTIAGSAKAIHLSVLIPGNRGLIARQAFTDLRDGTLKTFFELCPPELILSHNKGDHLIKIKSKDPMHPSEIVYRGLGEESEMSSRAKEKAKALEVGWLWIDEPSDVSFDAYRQMLGQLRWVCTTGRRPPYMAFLTSNPEPGWVKDRFIDPSADGYIMNLGPEAAAFIPSLPADNPGLPADYIQTLRSTNDAEWIRRYLEGSWDIHEGMVFSELSERLHNLDNWVSDDRWKDFHAKFLKYGCMDHADTGITAYLITGFDPAENCYALAEYYRANALISEHCAGIKALDAQYNGVSYRLMDPSCESKYIQNRDEMISVADAYAREGVQCLPAIRAKISVGIDLVKERLQYDAPRLFISKKRCPNLWKEMQGLKTEAKPDGTLIFKGRDHACFPAGTIVDTPDGAKSIENIKRGDRIYTHLGIGIALTDAVCNGIKNIISLTIGDTMLYCTPNHKFMTPSGMKAAVDLAGGTIWQKKSSITKESDFILGLGVITSLQRALTRAIKAAKNYIKLCGKIIMGPSLTELRSITLMETAPTTGLRIYSLSYPKNIHPDIIPRTSERQLPQPQLGTRPQQVKNGIANTVKKFKRILFLLKSSVNGAGSNILQSKMPLSIAAMLTKHILAWLQVWIISMFPAQFAENFSRRIAINLRKHAPVNVTESYPVICEETNLNLPVYNFSSSHGTYFSSGILVSNCDCVRYTLMSRPRSPEHEEIDIGSLSTPAQVMIRTQKKWAETWGRERDTGSWF